MRNIFESVKSHIKFSDMKAILPSEYVPSGLKKQCSCISCNNNKKGNWFIKDSTLLFHCFVCNFSADVIGAFAEFNSMEQIDAAKSLAETFNIQYDSTNTLFRNKKYTEYTPITDDTEIDMETEIAVKKAGIDYSSIGSNSIVTRNKKLYMQVVNVHGETTGMQSIKQHFVAKSELIGGMFVPKNKKGFSKLFDPREPFFITEGVRDTALLWELGVKNVFGVTSASIKASDLSMWLSRVIDNKVTILLDPDTLPKENKERPSYAGMKLAKNMKTLYGDSICVKFMGIEKNQDIMDLYENKAFTNKAEFLQLVDRAPEFTEQQMLKAMGKTSKATDICLAEEIIQSTDMYIMQNGIYEFDPQNDGSGYKERATGDGMGPFLNDFIINFMRTKKSIEPEGQIVYKVMKQLDLKLKKRGADAVITADLWRNNAFSNNKVWLSKQVPFHRFLWDISTGETHPYPREVLIFNKIKGPDDMDAECPVFLTLLDECFAGDPEAKGKIASIRKVFATSLMAFYAVPRIFYWYGGGGDGKSFFSNLWSGILGQEFSSAVRLEDIGTDNASHQLEPLAKSFFNISPEARKTKLYNSSNMKAITGGDQITINPKYHRAYKIYCPATMLIVGNRPPPINKDGEDAATIRRFEPIFFPNNLSKTGKKDGDLLSKLSKERDGIMTWALAYTNELYENNFYIGKHDGVLNNFKLEQFKASPIYEFISSEFFEEYFFSSQPGFMGNQVNPTTTYTRNTLSDVYTKFKTYSRDFLSLSGVVNLVLFNKTIVKNADFIEASLGIKMNKKRFSEGFRWEISKIDKR